MTLFDKDGEPNGELEDFANALEKEVIRFLENYPELDIIELRATSSVLTNAVQIAITHQILEQRYKKSRPKNTNLNLTQEEQQNARTNKIQTIRMYRERTGQGLKESKDAVELYLRENHEQR